MRRTASRMGGGDSGDSLVVKLGCARDEVNNVSGTEVLASTRARSWEERTARVASAEGRPA